MTNIQAYCYGSCGELYQGIVDGEEYLISYQIDKKNSVYWDTAQTVDDALPKMMQARRLLQCKKWYSLQRDGQLPLGKGCASSTADILATLKLITHLEGKTLTNAELTTLCAQIEPTDSIAFSNWTAINALTGQIKKTWTWQPKLYVYILEPRATLDTLSLPRMSNCSQFDAIASERTYVDLCQAIRCQDLAYLGDVVSQCALLNQARLEKPYLQELLQFVKSEKLLGLNIAHSGTVIGLLLQESDVQRITELEEKIKRENWADVYSKRTLCQLMYKEVGIIENGNLISYH